VEERSHTVVQVLNGNTIRLKDGLTVQLIGINDTPEAFDYLKESLLNERIKFVSDRSSRRRIESAGQRVYAYLTTNRGLSVNAEILKKRLSPLNTEYLTDSLKAFEGYAGDESLETELPNERPAPKSPEKRIRREQVLETQLPDKPYQPLEGKSLRELVKIAEPCVFLVYALNESNQVLSSGTGFFINGEGLAVSNYHVFEGAKRWAIKTRDGKTYPVESIIDFDKRMDYLTFKVSISDSPYLKLSETLPEKGEDIFVLGNPKGLESTLTRGVVSAFRDRFGKNDFIQIDAAISPGSSGSPVMNMQGDVVGIATAQLEKCESCNFAVNIQLIKGGL
jgi:serine protease Do